MAPGSDAPVVANFASEHLTLGAGVAIFHLATGRVVCCYDPQLGAWFLPKGRRDANEQSGAGAEREGFEESGYRNRLLPLPLPHRQPRAHNPAGADRAALTAAFVTEPVWTQLLPLTARRQYIVFWYVAETVPASVERDESAREPDSDAAPRPYHPPPPFPLDATLAQRIALDGEDYTPIRHPSTGVDDDERQYQSFLLPVPEARARLRGSVMEDVVRRGWEAICLRLRMEEAAAKV